MLNWPRVTFFATCTLPDIRQKTTSFRGLAKSPFVSTVHRIFPSGPWKLSSSGSRLHCISAFGLGHPPGRDSGRWQPVWLGWTMRNKKGKQWTHIETETRSTIFSGKKHMNIYYIYIYVHICSLAIIVLILWLNQQQYLVKSQSRWKIPSRWMVIPMMVKHLYLGLKW